jgi:hypothetical protein
VRASGYLLCLVSRGSALPWCFDPPPPPTHTQQGREAPAPPGPGLAWRELMVSRSVFSDPWRVFSIRDPFTGDYRETTGSDGGFFESLPEFPATPGHRISSVVFARNANRERIVQP